jgi:hypothetical protein
MVAETLQSAVIGMILGDASLIQARGCHGAYLQFRHSPAQREYALWKAEILRSITHVSVTESDGYLDARTGKKYPFINVKTRQHPLYTKLRQAFYPVRHKVVDPFWLNKLDERGFAIWYFDDGTSKPYHSYLATLGFSWPENQVMAKFIWERFGLHAQVRRWDKGKPIVQFPTKSRQALRDLLAQYAEPASMGYKLPDVRPLRGANLKFAKAGKPRGWYPQGDEIVRSPESIGELGRNDLVIKQTSGQT